jgi:Tfp pilus assembly protein PilX
VRKRRTKGMQNEDGIVLVAAIIVLLAITALVAASAMVAVLEKNATFNRQVASRALYAADSGVEMSRQVVTEYAQAKLDSLTAIHNGSGVIIANPNMVFPAGGLSVTNTTEPIFSATTTLVFEDSTLDLQSQVYNYRYTTTVSGSQAFGEKTVVSEGRLRVSATRGSFADYLLFTDSHVMPGGGDVWFHTSGHFDGRVHSNDKFRFAYFPTFEDLTTSAASTAWYYNNGKPKESKSKRNSDRDVPNFYGGFELDSPVIELPENSFSQERAALGGNPGNTTTVTNSEIRAALGLPSGSSPAPSGVYVPNSGGAVTGGIYVAGNAKGVTMSVSGANQVVAIKDANNLTTTITIDHSNGTTTVAPPTGFPYTLTGVPRGVLYTRGNVNSLKGPNRSGSTVLPAIASDQQLSVVSTGDIVVQGDLAYQDYDNGENVLGLFSSGGSVRIGTSAPDDLKVDAYVLASANAKVFSVDSHNSGSYRGTVRLRGGMVTNFYGAFGTFSSDGSMTGYGRDFRYDRRGYIPPYYPLTARFVPDRPQPQVVSWREVTE